MASVIPLSPELSPEKSSPSAVPQQQFHPNQQQKNSNLVRNFDLASVLPVSPLKPLPAKNSLSREDSIDIDVEKNMFERFFRQFASFASVSSGAGRNVYNNCTFNKIVKSDRRRKINIIESDSESSQEF